MKTSLNTCVTVLSLAAVLLTGCPADQNTETTLGCTQAKTVLALGDSTALGFSAQDALNNLEASYEASLTWKDGSSTLLTLGIDDREGSIEFVDQEMEESSNGADPAMEAMPMCEDFVTIPVTLSMVTADGRLAESWELTMQVSQVDQTIFYHEVAPDALSGTYALQVLDPTGYDDVKLTFTLEFAPQVATGAMYEFGSSTEGGEDGVASAVQEQVGTWAPAGGE